MFLNSSDLSGNNFSASARAFSLSASSPKDFFHTFGVGSSIGTSRPPAAATAMPVATPNLNVVDTPCLGIEWTRSTAAHSTGIIRTIWVNRAVLIAPATTGMSATSRSLPWLT